MVQILMNINIRSCSGKLVPPTCANICIHTRKLYNKVNLFYIYIVDEYCVSLSLSTVYIRHSNTPPIEPMVTNCDISDNNSQLKCVIADVTGK